MRRVALKVAYIGTDFHGFQRQPNQKTVEGELILALKEANLIDDLNNCSYAIAGRTDKGVHSLGNVITFKTDENIRINYINDLLPKSIRIIGEAGVPFDFKPRYAKSRYYRYVLVNDVDLNLSKIKNASKIMEGTHDFSNFSKKSERNPIRTVDNIEILLNNDVLMIDVVGESFLWNMVRKIASSLYLVGSGELEIKDIQKFLTHSTCAAIVPLPPEGLILMDIKYQDVKFNYDEYARKKFLSSLIEEYKYYCTIAAAEKVMIDILHE